MAEIEAVIYIKAINPVLHVFGFCLQQLLTQVIQLWINAELISSLFSDLKPV